MNSSARQLAYLDAMGIQVWQERLMPKEAEVLEVSHQVRATNLSELEAMTKSCQRCESSETRQQVVFGRGDEQATLLIVGDFPSKQDDLQGKPFVEAAGQLLDNMLIACGLKKSSTYLTVSTKCHSLSSDMTKKTELSSCREYLVRQIELVQPSVVLVFGEQAAQSLLKSTVDLSELRQKSCSVEDVSAPIFVSHTPSYLLENPLAKKQSWSDLCLARSLIK
jgi:uracil-DNA glycosylase family 4